MADSVSDDLFQIHDSLCNNETVNKQHTRNDEIITVKNNEKANGVKRDLNEFLEMNSQSEIKPNHKAKRGSSQESFSKNSERTLTSSAAQGKLNDHGQKRSKKEEPTPAGGAFAKLKGCFMDWQDQDSEDYKPFLAYVQQLPCILGRTHKHNLASKFISLGDSKSISKQHAILDYDPKLESFKIVVEGKNGIIVSGRYYRPNEQEYVRLSSKDPIKIGNVGFYFLCVNEEKPRKPYGELAVEVFEDLAVHCSVPGGVALGSKEICELLERKYRYYHNVKASSNNNLMNSFSQALRRCNQVMKAGTMKSFCRASEKVRIAYLLRSDETKIGREVRSAIEKNVEPTSVFDVDTVAEQIKGLYVKKLQTDT